MQVGIRPYLALPISRHLVATRELASTRFTTVAMHAPHVLAITSHKKKAQRRRGHLDNRTGRKRKKPRSLREKSIWLAKGEVVREKRVWKVEVWQ